MNIKDYLKELDMKFEDLPVSDSDGYNEVGRKKLEVLDFFDGNEPYDLEAIVSYIVHSKSHIYTAYWEWLESKKDNFGKDILFIGDEWHVLPHFIAMQLPDSKITVGFRNRRVFTVATYLQTKLHVPNIEFRFIKNIKLSQKFDTVLQHYSYLDIYDYEELQLLCPIVDQVKMCRTFTAGYALDATVHLKDEGFLYTVFNQDRNPMFLGWLYNLKKYGCDILLDEYTELSNKPYQCIVAQKHKNIKRQDLIAWCYSFINKSKTTYHKFEADMIAEYETESVIEGFLVKETIKDPIFSYALLKSKKDDDTYFVKYKEDGYLKVINQSQLEEEKQKAKTIKQDYENMNYIIEDIHDILKPVRK